MNQEVIIVGAGPVGMTLASELGGRGIRTLVLEQKATPERTEPRALTLHRRTLDQLALRGLAAKFEQAFEDLLIANGVAEPAQRVRPRPHFGGIAGFADPHSGGRPGTILVDRSDVERIVRERAVGTGVRVAHAHRVTAIRQDVDRVVVSCAADGAHREVEGSLVVGCDGPRSVVRRCAGIDFDETPPTLTTLMGLVRRGAEDLPGGWERLDDGWFMRMIDGRIAVTEWRHDPAATGPPTLGEFEDAIERVTGHRPHLVDPVFLSRYSDRTGLATTYRNRRVLIAGDAAHVHFPAGGQGLNLGMQDAFNLGWKVFEALRCGRWDLLDTYGAERRPVAEAVIANTQAQLAVMRPGAQVSALRSLFESLVDVDGVAEILCGLITGTSVRTSRNADDQPLVGRFHNDVAARLTDRCFPEKAFETGRHVLFVDDDSAVPPPGAPPFAADAVVIPTGAPDTQSFLFRPDGYLAWARPSSGAAKGEELVHVSNADAAVEDRHGFRSHPDYMLGASDSEIEHLVVQAESYAPSARNVIERLDVGPDWNVVDMGCGALGILHLLAERVDSRGTILGVDREQRMLAVARRQLDERSLQRVSLVQADVANTDIPRHSVDLVHARTLLINVSAAEWVVSQMAALVRPGGFLALQEPDGSAWVCEPRHSAWDTLRELFCERYRAQGCDPQIGRRLPGLLRGADLHDVTTDVRPTAVTGPGDWNHTQLPSFIRLIRDSLVELGLCSVSDLDRLLGELDAHLAKPGTVTYCPLWQAWGRQGELLDR